MDVIQDAIARNKHISDYEFHNDQTWDGFWEKASGRDIYLYGLGKASGYFMEKYGEKIKLCGAIDSYINLQGFCVGDYLPEAVGTPCERIPIYDSGILMSLVPEKTLVLITNINGYEEIAEQLAAYHIECFVLLLLEAGGRSGIHNTDAGEKPDLQYQKKAYAGWCCGLPVEQKKIVFMIGKYGGHAKYITKALLRKGSGLDLVWLVEDLRIRLPEGVRPVSVHNWKKYIYEMETARVWVFDILVPEFVRKREEQIYIQTKHWPGITLKKFFLDDRSTTSTVSEIEYVKYNGKIMDYILVGSDFDQNTCKSGFAYHGAYIYVGSPRTDALFCPNYRSKVYSKYHIEAAARTVLYAPTFRYNKEKRKKAAVRGLDFQGLRDILELNFGGKWEILFRGHPSLSGIGKNGFEGGKVIDVSGYDDSQELVAACDLLISDYSSIMFEAAFAGKPVLLFAPDQKQYIGKERELYIAYESLPFPMAETNEELRSLVEKFDYDAYKAKVALFLQKYGVREDGHASERAAEFMLTLMERRHKISVIVPIYNTAADLPRCIDSVINQTYRDIEIILVDDGSTDGSLQICEEYARKDSRIILMSQENKGNNAARKAGLKVSAGEYVMFVDSDDWIGSSLVSLLYQQAEEHQADLVISNVLMTRVGGREEERKNLIAAGIYTNPKDAVKKLFFNYEDCRYGILPYIFAKLYRKELAACSMEKIDDRIQYDEDRALVWTCLMQDITAVFIDNTEYHYCQRADGLVRAGDEMYLAKVNYFYCYMKRLFEKEDAVLIKQLERYVVWNVQIAFKWKLGMSENALPQVKEKYKSGSMAGGIKVSVIIPSFNAAAYLGQCLDSVRRQTLPEIEILCVDAGSTDKTIDILKEYAALDSRIHYLVADQKSYGYQMNLGIDAAKGEYIGIVEPDDYVAEEMFERLYEAAHGGELDYVKSDFYKFMDYLGRRHYQRWERSYWGKHDEIYNKVIRLKDTPYALVYGDHGNIWSGIYRRKFLRDRRIRFHETPGASYQDTGFALLCTLEAERVMFLEECFYRYRQGGAGTSVRSQDKHSVIITEYAWIWEQMKRRGFTDEVSRSFYMAMKLHSYLWNYNRLQPEGRNRFLENLVKDEMLAFNEEIIGFQIPEKDRVLRLWRGDWQEVAALNQREEKKRNNTEELLALLEKASQIVVVCAGEWGVSLLQLCRKLGIGNLCTVCDNSSAVQGQSVEGMDVVSVERAVREHPDAYFIIANKCHAQELDRQLAGLGVASEKIYVCREKAYKGNMLIKFLSAR